MAHAAHRAAHRTGQRLARPRRLAVATAAALCLLATAIGGCTSTPDVGREPAGEFSLLRDPPPESPQTVDEWMAQPRVNP
jgi:hypothetical protein